MSTYPYYPPGVSVANYTLNTRSTPGLITIFVLTCTAILTTTHALVKRSHPQIPTPDLATAQWFVLCGCIHVILEGYYATNGLGDGLGGLQDNVFESDGCDIYASGQT